MSAGHFDAIAERYDASLPALLPDFVPRAALPVAAAAERLAARTPLVRRLCAHNVVLAAKPGGA